MKYLLYSLFLIAAFENCHKTQPVPPDQGDPVDTIPVIIDTTPVEVDTPVIELGQVSMLKNGIKWSVPSYARWQKAPSTFFMRSKILYSNYVSELFSIADIPTAAGKYPIQLSNILQNWNNDIPESIFIMTHEYDEPMGDFLIDTTRHDHYLEILRYDSITHIVEGRFQVFLGKDPMNFQWPGVPDSIFMTEGKFHLKIE